MKRIALLSASVVLVLCTILLVTSHVAASDGCPGKQDGWVEVVVPEQARDIWDHWNLTEPVSKVCIGGVTFTVENPSGPCIKVSGLGTNNVFIDRFCPGLNKFSYLLEIPPTATSTSTATATLTSMPTVTFTATSTPIPLTSTPTATATMNLATEKMTLDKTWIVPIALVVLLFIVFAVILLIVARNKKKK